MTAFSVADLPERIASKIEVDETTGCWEWQAGRSEKGYGIISWEGRTVGVHRLTYHLLRDPDCSLRPGTARGALVLDHYVCDNPPCCHPAHLTLTTKRLNASRKGGSSEFTGVYWHSSKCRWHTQVVLPSSDISKHLGYYSDEVTAAHVYDAAAFIVVADFPNWAHGRLDRWPTDEEFSTAARHLQRHGVEVGR